MTGSELVIAASNWRFGSIIFFGLRTAPAPSVVRRSWIGAYSDGRLIGRKETPRSGGGMRFKAVVLVLSVATFFLLAFSGAASAASFTVLHSFSGLEGETPAAPLVQGADGFFYGVAAHGGDFTVLPPDGGGTAFRMDFWRR